MNERKKQLGTRKSPGTHRRMFPTEREVLLAKMLLCCCDVLGKYTDVVFDPHLYDSIKSIAEPIVRESEYGTPQTF